MIPDLENFALAQSEGYAAELHRVGSTCPVTFEELCDETN
jgi:hypothetical protein